MPQHAERHDGYTVVRLEGEIDMASSPGARHAILDALQHRNDVLVDLSAVTYLDSSGVANLVEGYQLARHKGVHFGLVGTAGAAESVLRLARLDHVFPTYPSLAAWLEQARSDGR
jgi:anti-sigma B factor antagonist